MKKKKAVSCCGRNGYAHIGRKAFFARLRPVLTPRELEKVELAYALSKYGHRGQSRDDGVRYFEHPKAVALILIDELGVTDWRDIVLALLHDMLEDSFLLNEKLVEKLFGRQIVRDLKLLTKRPKNRYLARMIKYGNVRVWRVKLCDRLHNLRTLGNCSRRKQRRQILETRKKYLPLVDLLISKLPAKDRWQGEYLKKEIEKICKRFEERFNEAIYLGHDKELRRAWEAISKN